MQRPLRVLHIVPSLRPDGAERIAVHIVTGLDKRRFEAALVSISEPVDSDLERALQLARVRVWYLGKKGRGFDARVYPRMQPVFRAFRPEVLHTHLGVLRYAFPSMMYYQAQLMVHTVHNIAEYEIEWYGRVLQHLAYAWGMVPVAVAREVARSVERLYHLSSCRVIRNGVPTEVYRTPKVARAEWRAINGFREQDVLFVSVGRLESQKNHLLLLRAFAQGPAADGSARLVLVGKGSLDLKLRAAAESLGLADRVHFLGTRTDIPDVLGAMDVFVLSSDWEGNPISLMEAMSAGLPVVSTAVGGVPELFQNGKQGFLVQCGDVSGISRALVSLLDNPDARRSMGAAASMTARENCNVATMVGAYEDLYEDLLSALRLAKAKFASLKSQ